MASGLAALLDDVAAIARMAAASLDDVTAAASKAGSKAVGVVVDDTAVTPGYAIGFTPERELPVVRKIALGSLRNKFLFLLPGALLLSAFAPWAVTPILMLGGAYLCFEATEKIIEAATGHSHATPDTPRLAQSFTQLEAEKVSGAIRTDLILSGEIMAIALASVADRPLAIQAGALALVSLGITMAVYGVVALIVKMDDIGVHLALNTSNPASGFGRGLVKAMPPLLKVLNAVGTAAMLWVGSGILVHGLDHFGFKSVPNAIEHVSHLAAVIPGAEWPTFALASAMLGMVVGGVIMTARHLVRRQQEQQPAV